MVKRKCIICGEYTEGRGNYSFRYLDETVFLCGHHAQKVMKMLKSEQMIRRRKEKVKM
jgi:hypothetical protein